MAKYSSPQDPEPRHTRRTRGKRLPRSKHGKKYTVSFKSAKGGRSFGAEHTRDRWAVRHRR